MKQSILNWLKYSSILVLLLFSCKKKQKGFFDDFPPGKFDFMWLSDQNGLKDTLIGEVTGPYTGAGSYFFRKHLISGEDELYFKFSSRSNGVTIDNIGINNSQIEAKIVNYYMESDNLSLSFNKNDTLTGTFNLKRK